MEKQLTSKDALTHLRKKLKGDDKTGLCSFVNAGIHVVNKSDMLIVGPPCESLSKEKTASSLDDADSWISESIETLEDVHNLLLIRQNELAAKRIQWGLIDV